VKILVAGAAALMLVLAGCATTPGGAGTAGSGSSSPSPALAAAPVPALPLTCAQLFTIGAVQSQLHDTVSTRVDETHLGSTIEDLAVLQAGGTECVWGGQGMTDENFETGVTIDILPDAASEFAARQGAADAGTISGTIGSSSTYSCDTGFGCVGDALAGGYWMSFIVNDANGSDDAAAASAVEAIMKPIADAIAKAGGSVVAWAEPKTSFDGAALCSAATASALVTGAVGAGAQVAPGFADSGLHAAAANRERVTTCEWSGGDSAFLEVAVLPGGSWAWPLLAAAPPLLRSIGVPAAIELAGSDGALSGCGDGCASLVSVHNSVAFLGLPQDFDQATATAATQKLVAGIPTK
jgi:hypothetical protein